MRRMTPKHESVQTIKLFRRKPDIGISTKYL